MDVAFRSLSTRLIWGSCWLVLLLIIIIARLGYLQLACFHLFRSRGDQNFLRVSHTRALRGTIYDQRGRPLVSNRPVSQVIWKPTGQRHLTQSQKDLLVILETITDVPIASNEEMVQKIEKAERAGHTIVLVRDISFDQLVKIAEYCASELNITINYDDERCYLYGSIASHVIGYLGKQLDDPEQGKMGIEKHFDLQLRGNSGRILKTVNASGRDIEATQLEAARDGADIHTTLDIDLQTIGEQVFPMEHVGALLVMRPSDGSIAALLSRPGFDPAIFLRSISSDKWQELQRQHAFINRVTSACYPPGSIFKLVTASAALENGFVKKDEVINCRGFTLCGKRMFWCNRKFGHGNLSFLQAVAHSCNVPFFELAQQMDIDVFASYADRFGLGKKTGLMLPEREGAVPSRAWKKKQHGQHWWQGETLSVSIGQSYLLATPIQIARMIGSIFTGYLIKPRLLANEEIEQEPLLLQEETRDFLKESMRCVVKMGTGKRVRSVKDMEIYAKTSTAQTSALCKRMLGREFLEHGWFVSYVNYDKDEPLVLVILVENSGSSSQAAIIARDFLLKYKKLVDGRLENQAQI